MSKVKHIIKTNYFESTINSDNKNHLKVEFGDSKKEDFYPQIKILKHENEFNLSIRLKEDKLGTYELVDNKIKYYNDKIEATFYETEDKEGGHEFEVLLKEKPATNELVFTIQHKGLEFWYQPELTKEEIEEGYERPENTIGSYAVYHTQKKTYTKGKQYGTCKFCHIYRPWAEDADGTRIWCDLDISEDLTITIPQDFLDNAIYPILIDPTFGYTTDGSGVAAALTSSSIARCSIVSPLTASAGDIVRWVSCYCWTSSATATLAFAIYTLESGYPVTRLAARKNIRLKDVSSDCVSEVANWALTEGITYCIAVSGEDTGSNAIRMKYDTGSAPGRFNSTNTTLESTFGWTGTDSGLHYSIFATYDSYDTNLIGITTSYNSIAGTALAVRIPFQRKTFYANGRFWLFYSDGHDFIYNTSTDGTTWTQSTLLMTGITGGYYISVTFDGTYVHYARAMQIADDPVYYRRGTPESNGTITWSAVEQSVYTPATGEKCGDPNICVDSTGHAWIGIANDNMYPYVLSNTNTDGTWSTNVSLQLADTTPNVSSTVLLPLTNGKVYAIWSDTKMKAKLWDGDSWGDDETISTSDISYDHWECYGAVAIDDNVYVVFVEDTSYDLISVNKISGTWGSESVIHAGITAYNTPCIAVAGTNVVCFWIADDSIYSSKFTSSWSVPVSLFTTSYGIPETISVCNITCSYAADANNKILVAWQAGPADPTYSNLDVVEIYLYTNSDTKTLVNKTDNYEILTGDCDGSKIFTNIGASKEITFTLPSPSNGLEVDIANDLINSEYAVRILGTIEKQAPDDEIDTTYGTQANCVADGTKWVIKQA